MEENVYHLRSFKRGDEATIVDLFNSTFREYAGFVPRTIEYWSWCCAQRPDVDEKGIVVVSKSERILGYAVAGQSGNIWEMCYDPTCDGETVVTKLLAWAVDYLKSAGSDSILLNFPTKDKLVRKVCSKLNFAENHPEYMFISILDFPRLITEVLTNSVEKQNINGQFLFRLQNASSSFGDSFWVEIQNGEFTVTKKAVNDPEIIVDVDAATLISCMLEGGNILKAIATSKIRFYPFWKILKVIKIFSLLRLWDISCC